MTFVWEYMNDPAADAASVRPCPDAPPLMKQPDRNRFPSEADHVIPFPLFPTDGAGLIELATISRVAGDDTVIPLRAPPVIWLLETVTAGLAADPKLTVMLDVSAPFDCNMEFEMK